LPFPITRKSSETTQVTTTVTGVGQMPMVDGAELSKSTSDERCKCGGGVS